MTALVVLAGSATDAAAFNPIKLKDGTVAHWRDGDMPIPYYVNPDGSGLSSGVEAAMQAGFASWMAPTCTYVEFSYQGTTGSSDALPTDNANNLMFITGTWPAELGGSGTIAVCTPAIYSDGTIRDADIRFNAADFEWSTRGEAGKMDIQNIATHEQGHFLGLDHTEVLDATMYPYSNKGDTERRTPKTDDINGVCYLYPNPDGASGAFGEPCAAGSDCDSGVCATDGYKDFCSKECEPGGTDCPGGFRCEESSGGAPICFPGDESDDLCVPCELGADCSGGLCMSDGAISVCSRPCMPASDSCPTDYYCAEIADSGGSGGCWPESESCDGMAEPQPAGADEPCSGDIPCKTGLVCSYLDVPENAKCYYQCEPCAPACPSATWCHEFEDSSGGMCFDGKPSTEPTCPGGGDGGGGDSDGGTDSDGGLADDLAGCACSVADTTAGDAFGLLSLAAIAAGVFLAMRRRR